MGRKKLSFSSVAIPAAVIFFNVIIMLFPKETIAASREGVKLWFETVLPSLLPFLIGANILNALGAVNFIGTMLEPLMRPLFNIPGNGGFALAVGLTSGYPMGAKVASELRKSNELTKHEAQRLIAFVNNSGPLFVLGAVAAGMFENIYAGYFILTVHYLSALTIGILFRLHKAGLPEKTLPAEKDILRRAYRAMIEKRKESPALGAILGQSVFNAMETMLQVGGFIILFCVIVKAFDITGLFDVICNPLPFAAQKKDLIKGIFAGIIEMTNGCKNIASLGISRETVLSAAAVISWGGLSIHAQAISFLSKTDISPILYLLSKLFHAAGAVFYGFILYPLFRNTIENAHAIEASTKFAAQNGVLSRLMYSVVYFSASILSLAFIIIIINGVFYITKSGKHINR